MEDGKNLTALVIPVRKDGKIEYMTMKDFVINLDYGLSYFLDLVFSVYNDTRKGYKGDSEEEWEEILLKLRDYFREYSKQDQPEFGGDEENKKREEIFMLFSDVYTGLWQ